MTVGVLKLRGAQRRTCQRVAWDADVVDNEGCGKKKSKSACFVHALVPKRHAHTYADEANDLHCAHDSLLYIP